MWLASRTTVSPKPLSAEQGGADIILVVAVLHQLIRQNLQLFRQLGLFAQEGLHRIGAFINKRIHFGGFVPAMLLVN